MSSMAVPLVAPAPGLRLLGAAPAPVPAPLAPAPMAAAPGSMVPASQQLSKNPMLPQHPLGAYTDAQYESQNAILRAEVAKRYADLLQQLGYADENGNFVQGSVETNARKAESGLRRSADLATEDVTHQHQQLGTLFSGLRGTDQARAEYPYTNQIADIETQTPLTLQGLFEKAGGLISDYTLQQNQLLADAADRRTQGLLAGGGGAGGDAGSSPTTPPAQAGGIPNLDDAFSGPVPPGSLGTPDANGYNWIFGNTAPTVGAQAPPTAQIVPNSFMAPHPAPTPMPVVAPTPDTAGILSATQKKLLNNQMLG